QWKFKSGTAPFGGLHIQHRTVCFNNIPYKRKPKPGAAIAARGGTIQLMERFKNIVYPIKWDANACICDGCEDKVFAFAFYTDNYAPSGRCEFDAVINELVQHPGYLL